MHVNLTTGTGTGSGFADTLQKVEAAEGGGGNDVLIGGTGATLLRGNAGNDDAQGSALDDTLFGGNGNDRLVGDAGSDRLVGGSGHDQLEGTSGGDIYAYVAVADSGPGAANRDVVADFFPGEGDRIDLSAVPTGSGAARFDFIGTGAFSAAGQVRFVTTPDVQTIVQVNTDADAQAEMEIFIATPLVMNNGDFIL